MKKRTIISVSIAAAAAVGYFFYFWNKKKKNFTNSTDNELQFILTNNTSSQQSVTLFDSSSTQTNPAVGIQSNPNIQFFNASLNQEPKKIKYIQLTQTGTNQKVPQQIQSQVNKPMTVICTDANGNEVRSSLTPIVSPYQAQGNATVIHPNDLILDGRCKVEYTLSPMSQISMLVNYSTK